MRKWLKKAMASIIVLTIVLGMALNVYAAEELENTPTNTGTLTINGTTEGKEIDLYQIFSATVSGEKVAYTLEKAFEGYFKTLEGFETLTGDALSKAAYDYVAALDETEAGVHDGKGNGVKHVEFAKAVLMWILELKDANTIEAVNALKTQVMVIKDGADVGNKAVNTTASNGVNTTSIAGLPYGYYLVYPLGAADISREPNTPAMLVSVTDQVLDGTINMKSDYPTVNKVIVVSDGVDTKASDVGIGDSVTFKLTSTVPDMTGYNSYIFKMKDTLSNGLTFNEITSVKIGATVLKNMNDLDKTDDDKTYTLSQEGQKIEIQFNNFIDYKVRTNDLIEVIYTATLNKNAVVGTTPNTNEAMVEYSNDPSNEEKTDTSTPSIVDVHTFDFTIFKFHVTGDSKEPLSGVTFKLYRSEVCDEADVIKLTEVTTNVYIVDDQPTESSNSTITTDTNGNAKVQGLADGTYYLKEINPLEGYNALVGPIKIEIHPTYNSATNKLDSYTVNYTYNDIKGEANESHIIPIENKSGSVLPNTGGMGTMIFTIGGAVILAVMIVSSVVSRRRKRQDEEA